MTQKIQKYRRKVSNITVKEMTKAYTGTKKPSKDELARMRHAFEANADVIEGVFYEPEDMYQGRFIRLFATPEDHIYFELPYQTLEEFYTEWEEIL